MFAPHLTSQDESVSTNQTLSGNPLNVDPPQSLADYVSSLNDSVSQYVEQVEQYQFLANQTQTINMIGESVINAVSLCSQASITSQQSTFLQGVCSFILQLMFVNSKNSPKVM